MLRKRTFQLLYQDLMHAVLKMSEDDERKNSIIY